MKLRLKRLIILGLFLTIALPSISQVKYVIGKDTLVAYTAIENRTIAKIFLEGERDHELLTNCNEEVATLLAKDDIRVKQIEELKKQNNLLNISYLNAYMDATNATKKARNVKRQLVIGKILIVALGAFAVIK